jgi:hypothetical protein
MAGEGCPVPAGSWERGGGFGPFGGLLVGIAGGQALDSEIQNSTGKCDQVTVDSGVEQPIVY